MRRLIFLIGIIPLLCGCVYIIEPKDIVYELTGDLYTARVYHLKVGVKNALGFLMAGTTIKVNGVEYKTDDFGYAVIQLYYEKAGIKELKIEKESIHKTLEIDVKKPSWLIFLWLASDNNLDYQAIRDLEEMKNAARDVSLIILWDSSDESKDGIYVMDGSTPIRIEETGEINSGDGNLLKYYTERFSKIDSNYKALIIWNHGLAWDDRNVYKTKGISYDDQSNDFFTIQEISDNVTGNWDVFGMDACLMGSIEVVYALKDVADYILASAHNIPGTGWDYNFTGSISQSIPLEMCEKIVDSYRDFYSNFQNISLAVYETKYISGAVDLFNEFLSTTNTELQKSSWTTYSSSYCLYDLGEVLESLQATQVWNGFSQVVVYKYLSNSRPKSLATSIFVCKDIEKMNYDSTRFAIDTVWDEFLLGH
ncbi:clostripain-related cysteine peptidase [Thermotoga profunda]|uniref:clostripain-related cysteine peptidase n=1 Tax=Thermotoga profunda TaxID=1508420 RepID=UPI0005975A9E|nr:clostripain-related cysteine peptidase [Thermotoga profunda]